MKLTIRSRAIACRHGLETVEGTPVGCFCACGDETRPLVIGHSGVVNRTPAHRSAESGAQAQPELAK